MICTYLTAGERETMSTVHDKELNELFQNVRKVTGDNFWIQERTLTKRNLFGRIKNVVTLYILYASTLHNRTGDIIEVHIINFPPENIYSGSINTCVSKAFTMTYLFGTLNGLHVAKHDNTQNINNAKQ